MFIGLGVFISSDVPTHPKPRLQIVVVGVVRSLLVWNTSPEARALKLNCEKIKNGVLTKNNHDASMVAVT